MRSLSSSSEESEARVNKSINTLCLKDNDEIIFLGKKNYLREIGGRRNFLTSQTSLLNEKSFSDPSEFVPLSLECLISKRQCATVVQ